MLKRLHHKPTPCRLIVVELFIVMEDHTLYSAPSTPKPTDKEPTSPETMSPVLGSEFTYKMTDEEIGQFVKLRASNKKLFTGRKHSAKLAWRAILKEMGLQKKMSTLQAKKKWDNLQMKYKELKNPPPGVTVVPGTWRWFSLMDDAMEGRLDGTAPEVSLASAAATQDGDFMPNKPSGRRYLNTFRKEPLAEAVSPSLPATTAATLLAHKNEIGFLVNNSDVLWMPSGAASQQEMEMDSDQQEYEQERSHLDIDRMLAEREREVLERERMVLERERAGLQRELAALDRDRAALERERASVERDRAAVDWERAMLEKERARIERDRLAIGLDNVATRRDYAAMAMNGRINTSAGIRQAELDPECLERKQKFLDLFEKLLEKI